MIACVFESKTYSSLFYPGSASCDPVRCDVSPAGGCEGDSRGCRKRSSQGPSRERLSLQETG